MLSVESQPDLAELTATTVDRMSRDQLIDLLRSADVPFLRAESLDRLDYWDRPTLCRLAHLLRRCHIPSRY